VARETEFAEHATRTPRQLATIAQAGRVSVTWESLQFGACIGMRFFTGFAVSNDCLKCSTLFLRTWRRGLRVSFRD